MKIFSTGNSINFIDKISANLPHIKSKGRVYIVSLDSLEFNNDSLSFTSHEDGEVKCGFSENFLQRTLVLLGLDRGFLGKLGIHDAANYVNSKLISLPHLFVYIHINSNMAFAISRINRQHLLVRRVVEHFSYPKKRFILAEMDHNHARIFIYSGDEKLLRKEIVPCVEIFMSHDMSSRTIVSPALVSSVFGPIVARDIGIKIDSTKPIESQLQSIEAIKNSLTNKWSNVILSLLNTHSDGDISKKVTNLAQVMYSVCPKNTKVEANSFNTLHQAITSMEGLANQMAGKSFSLLKIREIDIAKSKLIKSMAN